MYSVPTTWLSEEHVLCCLHSMNQFILLPCRMDMRYFLLRNALTGYGSNGIPQNSLSVSSAPHNCSMFYMDTEVSLMDSCWKQREGHSESTSVFTLDFEPYFWITWSRIKEIMKKLDQKCIWSGRTGQTTILTLTAEADKELSLCTVQGIIQDNNFSSLVSYTHQGILWIVALCDKSNRSGQW